LSAAERLETPIAAAAVSPPLKPRAIHKFFYSIGQTAQSGGFDTAIGFSFFYYTVVLRLDGALVGLALGISLAFDAVVDPVVGAWSDNIRSRFGRRLPPMMLATPLMLLAVGALFTPPSLSQWGLFAWLTACSIAARSFISLFNVPYFALGGEMAEGYAERSAIVAWRANAGLVMGLLVTAAAYSIFFRGELGLRNARAYAPFGWAAGVLIFAASALCIAGIRKYAARLPAAHAPSEPLWRRLPREFAIVLANRSFRILFFSAVAFYVAVGVNATLANHAAVFVWKLRTPTIQLLVYAYLAGMLPGIVTAPMFTRRFEKKTLVLVGVGGVVLSWMLLPGLRALRIIEPTGDQALMLLILNGLIVGYGVGLVAVAYPSMMADAADEHELISGRRQEGLYFAGLGFAGKAAAGFGAMIGGFALSLIGFPKDVAQLAHAVLAEPVAERLMLAHGPLAALLAGLGMLIFAPYAVTRRRHDEITAALHERRQGGG
jgi:GPH family glycoside/pentoside/hexuronide:cation symporter